MKPAWVTKTDPVKHPVRFLGSIWQRLMNIKFGIAEQPLTPKEYGQLKVVKQHLGDLTRDLIEWVVDPINWWYFRQEVRGRWKTLFVPERPDIGFLLKRRGVALRVMRSKLIESGTNEELVKKLDAREHQQIKDLALVYASGNSDQMAKVQAANTLPDIQQVLNEILDHNIGNSANDPNQGVL